MSWANPAQSLRDKAQEIGLADRCEALRPGGLLTIVGVDTITLVEHLPSSAPYLLRLDLAGVGGHQAIIARVLDDLAALALRAWPAWPEAKLPPWGRAAGRLAAASRPPRFRNVANETQLSELAAAAGGPALLFAIDPARGDRAAPEIAALEWCRRHGVAVVALLADVPPVEPPWDRIMQNALVFERSPVPVASRLLIPPGVKTPGGSVIEKRMRHALAADHDLAGLFEDEVTLKLGPLGPTPRVDLLWREGRVVVELDGAEHERDPNYGADRHRDFELLVAGYLVLRLTNDEVALDLGRSLDKVRRVVNLRRSA